MLIQAADGSYYPFGGFARFYVSGDSVEGLLPATVNGSSSSVTLFSCPSADDAEATLAEIATYLGVVPIAAVTS